MNIGQKLYIDTMFKVDTISFKNLLLNHTYDYIAKPVLSEYTYNKFYNSFSESYTYKENWFKSKYCNENTWFYQDNIRIHKNYNNLFSLKYCFINEYRDNIVLLNNATANKVLEYLHNGLLEDISTISEKNIINYKPLNNWIKCGIV